MTKCENPSTQQNSDATIYSTDRTIRAHKHRLGWTITTIQWIQICADIFALAAPVNDSKNAQILKYENDNIGVDGYKFAYETSDGVSRSEQDELKNPGTEQEAISVRGTISWVAPDGQQYTLNYIADENGFQPSGDHLPKV